MFRTSRLIQIHQQLIYQLFLGSTTAFRAILHPSCRRVCGGSRRFRYVCQRWPYLAVFHQDSSYSHPHLRRLGVQRFHCDLSQLRNPEALSSQAPKQYPTHSRGQLTFYLDLRVIFLVECSCIHMTSGLFDIGVPWVR